MKTLNIRFLSLAFGLSLGTSFPWTAYASEQSATETADILVVDHGSEVGSGAQPPIDAEKVNAEVITERPPSRIYVEDNGRTYRSTRANEHCEYQEELDRIYCYDVEPTTRVYTEETRVYRTVRPKRYYRAGYDPIATGLGVGLAIGIPLLVHNSYDRHHRKYRRHHRYGYRYDNHYYGNHYYGKSKRYNRGYYRGYRDGYRNSNRRTHYFKYGKNRY